MWLAVFPCPLPYADTMPKFDTPKQWIETLAPGATISQAARKIGVNPAGLLRYISRNDTLSADHIIQIAEAYDHNPVTALVDMGKIRPDAVSRSEVNATEKRRVLTQLLMEITEDD